MTDALGLKRLHDHVAQRLKQIEKPSGADPWDASADKHQAARKFLAELEKSEGARVDGLSGSYKLRLAGINTSCTSGWLGLLRNWCRAARARIAKAEN